VRKALVLIFGLLMLYAFFREFTWIKVGLICAGIALTYAVSLIPGRYFMAAKYPVILLSFAVTLFLFFKPHAALHEFLKTLILFLAFYGIGFFLVTMEEKEVNAYREVIALSTLFLSSAFNLAITAQTLYILSMAIAVCLFLFVIGRLRIIALIALYTALIMIVLWKKDVSLFGGVFPMMEAERYLLLLVTFVLLLISFIGIVKNVNSPKLLAFFGFLYVATDILLVVGFKVSVGLLYQPAIAILLVSPLLGVLLRGEGGRL
jgi:hypothetical protein